MHDGIWAETVEMEIYVRTMGFLVSLYVYLCSTLLKNRRIEMDDASLYFACIYVTVAIIIFELHASSHYIIFGIK